MIYWATLHLYWSREKDNLVKFATWSNNGMRECPPNKEEKWTTWIRSLKKIPTIFIPRSAATKTGNHFKIHAFADTSMLALCESVYVVEHKTYQTISLNLLIVKSKVPSKGQTIPHLKLMTAHILTKLSPNITEAFNDFPVTEINYWVGGTTSLQWLQNKGIRIVIVRNRVRIMKVISKGVWWRVPVKENPSNLGTRGVLQQKLICDSYCLRKETGHKSWKQMKQTWRSWN